jgi:hypothetical protein
MKRYIFKFMSAYLSSHYYEVYDRDTNQTKRLQLQHTPAGDYERSISQPGYEHDKHLGKLQGATPEMVQAFNAWQTERHAAEVFTMQQRPDIYGDYLQTIQPPTQAEVMQ